jgi:predicted metal-dependent hydrolase
MPSIHDEEFGEIIIRRSVRSRSVRLSVDPAGALRASMPPYAPMIILKRLIASSRGDLRKMLERSAPAYKLENGAEIGKSHHLSIIRAQKTTVKRYKQQITVTLAPGASIHDTAVAQKVRDEITATLRLEAKSYLPNRLKFLANKLGCTYERVRFSHASSRWGSCSTTGTISLNIALMKLPFEIIDYVIIHELSHTKQMNHSPKFWRLVEDADPLYKMHRRILKRQSPTI